LQLKRHIWQAWTAPGQDKVSIVAQQRFLVKNLPIDPETSQAINALWKENEMVYDENQTDLLQRYLQLTWEHNEKNLGIFDDWRPLPPPPGEWGWRDLVGFDETKERSKQFLLKAMAPYVHDHSSDINSQLSPLKLPSAPLGSKEYGSLKADLSGAVKGDA
jgi:hypothetical protein